MKEKILNTFAEMGFQLDEMEGFGYGFRYEGINYLYMPNDEDGDFLSLAIPAVFEVTEYNKLAAFILMDKVNSTLKYVKANRYGDSIWLFYERELFGGEDFDSLLPRMIVHLEAANIFFHIAMEKLKSEINSSDDDTPTDDTEEAA